MLFGFHLMPHPPDCEAAAYDLCLAGCLRRLPRLGPCRPRVLLCTFVAATPGTSRGGPRVRSSLAIPSTKTKHQSRRVEFLVKHADQFQ